MDCRLAAAQSQSLPGQVSANLQRHLVFVQQAALAGVDLLLFPELSLSGYEPDHLAHCALDVNAPELRPLQQAAQAHDMTLIVGAPLRSGEPRPHIGALLFLPDGRIVRHGQQHLLPGETAFACPAAAGAPCYQLASLSVALSIGADSRQPGYLAAAAAAGARLALSSTLISEPGYPSDCQHLQGQALQHSIAVLLANHGAPTGGYASAGRSAFWDEQGHGVIEAPGSGSWLVVAEQDALGWCGRLIPVP